MNETQNQGLGISVNKSGEMAVAAMAAKAKAMVEAKYVIALQRPRSIMAARTAILDACKREKFAEGARYRKPVGKKKDPQTGEWKENFAIGFSIRFAEVAIQAMRNIAVESTVIYEDSDKRTVHVEVTDLESNISYGDEITVNKTVERKELKKWQESVGERTNSHGEKVFIVEATEDEIKNKIAGLASKIIRNNGLRLVPNDILEEAEEAVYQTLEKGGTDSAGDTKKVADAFAGINIKPSELEKFLGHALDSVSKKELMELRAIFTAIRDGEASWSDYVKEKEAFAAAKPIFEVKPEDNSNPDLTPAKKKVAKKEEAKEKPPEAPPQSAKAEAIDILTTKGIEFDEFSGWLTATGTFRDADSCASFDDIPSAVYDALMAGGAVMLARVVKIYGKGGAK